MVGKLEQECRITFLKDIALLRKRLSVFRTDVRAMGWSYGWSKVQDYLQGYRYVYDDVLDLEAVEQTICQFQKHPLISILLPVHAEDAVWLERAICSVQAQCYKHWQLCVVDDCSPTMVVRDFINKLNDDRIVFERLDNNLGISGATDKARAMATGEYITLLDHDDELTPDALFEAVKVINKDDPDVIYSDEDTITQEGHFLNGHFKPDFSPDLLLAHNYITHLLFVRTSLLEEVGGFRSEYDGAQDYDLVLRLTEVAKSICHIRKVLYHWRYVPTSVSRRDEHSPKTDDAGKRAIEDALKRRKTPGLVVSAGIPNHYDVQYEVAEMPRISVIIPNTGSDADVAACVDAVQKTADYENLECTVIQSADDTFASSMNKAVALAESEYVVLMMPSVRMQTPGWVRTLLGYAQQNGVACVGGKLITQDNHIHSYGAVWDRHNQLHLAFHGLPEQAKGYFNRLRLAQNVGVVPMGFVMLKKQVFGDLGGYNVKLSRQASAETDLCVRALSKGLRHVVVPGCLAIETRGKRVATSLDDSGLIVFPADGDPYYNLNLDNEHGDFRYRRSGSGLTVTYGIWERQ